ncbi:alpha/beta fold hydrolase [Ancylobacter defluvii]|uniref:3-oxoadipate enol-lactone hydrolase n=1 Tax=Ancylobacter defluvii TaxID=1282440 RepID=A0A9W6JU72_9HYPH|nr:alpha/beta fold hydrolase [Ancylobacter defluvii]MBS7588660.1 alpha/beta fold hydrolase [Ancylobacter defluvii]GLK83940.1 3-oxoadipate enol-lactone hydrolase [Ancylobacter defluvii]
MAFIDLNGERLGYDRAGTGEKLLLIHSLGTAAWLWRAQTRRWSAHFDVIAVDVRGHGRSSRNGGFTVRNVAADLAALLDAFGGEPARVVAISMGGPIAAHLVDIAPRLVSRLVIAGSFATQGEAGATRAAAIEKTIREGSMEAYARFYASDTLAEDGDPAHVDELVDSIAGMSADAYVEAARSVFTADVVELYKAVKVPTRVVVGSRDNRTPPKLSQEIAALVPGADYVEIEGARHLSNLDRPDGFHAAVDPFLLAR